MVKRVLTDGFYSSYADEILDVILKYIEDNNCHITETKRGALNLYLASKLVEMEDIEDLRYEEVTFYTVKDTNYDLMILNHCISLPEVTDQILQHCKQNKERVLIIDGLMFYGDSNQRFTKINVNDNKIGFEFVGRRLEIDKNKELEKVYLKSLEHFDKRKWLLNNSILGEQEQNSLLEEIDIFRERSST